MTDDATTLDALIERLRARALDAERRADVIVDAFSASVRTMSLGSLLGAARSTALDLDRVVREIQGGGGPGAASHARAEEIRQAMSTPAVPELPAVATEAAISRAEATLGGTLPPVIRRAYLEIADGGFGPGAGMLGIDAAVATYRDLRRESPGPRGSEWPAGMLPLVEMNPGWDCLDVPSGKIVGWDPEDLRERSGEVTWRRSFRDLAPSAQAWLTTWVGSRTQAERTAALMAASQVNLARQARARIAAMTPEERARMGLPEVGWERVVWGGIGLEEDEA